MQREKDAETLAKRGEDALALVDAKESENVGLRRECAAMRAREQELMLLMAERDAEAAHAMQQKETQIIQFLRAVEVKTAQRDDELQRTRLVAHQAQDELEETRAMLARTEAALAKVLQLHPSPMRH